MKGRKTRLRWGERSCEKEAVKRVDKDTKRSNDGRTEKRMEMAML